MERATANLIGRLNALATTTHATRERRCSPRERLPGHVQLELRRADGSVYQVSPVDVSASGLAFQFRNPLKLGESIGLRLIEHGNTGEFESAHVVHMQKDDQHYVVGVQLN